jgi:hypothetical protein
MQFLCVVYIDGNRMGVLSEGEQATLDRNSVAFDKSLMESGHYLGANALQPPETAKTVRVTGTRRSVTDGPFAETKEHLGGYLLIEANDMDEAVEIAARIPVGQYGCIEVRPVMKLE